MHTVTLRKEQGGFRRDIFRGRRKHRDVASTDHIDGLWGYVERRRARKWCHETSVSRSPTPTFDRFPGGLFLYAPEGASENSRWRCEKGRPKWTCTRVAAGRAGSRSTALHLMLPGTAPLAMLCVGREFRTRAPLLHQTQRVESKPADASGPDVVDSFRLATRGV
mgnify:CR=1 FL=1